MINLKDNVTLVFILQDEFHRLLTDVAIKGNLTAIRYIEICLCQQLITFHNQHNQQILFQHDNARPQKAMPYVIFNTEQHNTLPWPTLSLPGMSGRIFFTD